MADAELSMGDVKMNTASSAHRRAQSLGEMEVYKEVIFSFVKLQPQLKEGMGPDGLLCM